MWEPETMPGKLAAADPPVDGPHMHAQRPRNVRGTKPPLAFPASREQAPNQLLLRASKVGLWYLCRCVDCASGGDKSSVFFGSRHRGKNKPDPGDLRFPPVTPRQNGPSADRGTL